MYVAKCVQNHQKELSQLRAQLTSDSAAVLQQQLDSLRASLQEQFRKEKIDMQAEHERKLQRTAEELGSQHQQQLQAREKVP